MPDPTMYVVCEGHTDKSVLTPLLTQKFGLFVQLKAAGGEDIPGRGRSRASGSVRAYLEREGPGVVIAVSIQDRNFLPLQQVDKGWHDGTARKLQWRRHEIENYLLEPKVVAHAFARLRGSDDQSVARRYQRLPADEDTIAVVVREAAKKLFEDHAARMVEWEIYTSADRGNPSTYAPARPRPAPGALAPGRAEWLPVLLQEAERVRNASRCVAELPSMFPAQIEKRYEAELVRLNDPGFLGQSVHLSEMGGHELMSALRTELLTRYEAQFPADGLTTALTEALHEVYEPDSLFADDDFVKLATRLRQLAKSG